MNSFETFHDLHHSEHLFLIANAWDVSSARVFERCGFKAVATSSAALARTMGYEDGENIPFDLLLLIVKRIKDSINIPLSVDIEKGYGKDIPGILENISRLHDCGIAGFNIEDSSSGETRAMDPVDQSQKVIAAIMNHLARKNMKMYLNARTDAYLLKIDSPLPETVKRTKAYEEAGASGIFVPSVSEKTDIAEIVKSTKLPVNILCMQQLPNFKELDELGVKRISMGSAIHNTMTTVLEKTMRSILNEQSFNSLYALVEN